MVERLAIFIVVVEHGSFSITEKFAVAVFESTEAVSSY